MVTLLQSIKTMLQDIKDVIQLLPFMLRIKRGFSHGMVTFAFDDGWRSQLDAAIALKESGYSGSFYLAPGLIGAQHYLSIQDVLMLPCLGMDIAAHSMTHVPLTKLSLDELYQELTQSKHFLEQLGCSSISHLAAPYGLCNAQVIDAARNIYASHRGTREGFNTPFCDVFNIKIKCITNKTSLARIRKLVTWAQRARVWLVLSFHEISDTPTDIYNITPQNFAKLLQFLRENRITVCTVDEALKKIPYSCATMKSTFPHRPQTAWQTSEKSEQELYS